MKWLPCARCAPNIIAKVPEIVMYFFFSFKILLLSWSASCLWLQHNTGAHYPGYSYNCFSHSLFCNLFSTKWFNDKFTVRRMKERNSKWNSPSSFTLTIIKLELILTSYFGFFFRPFPPRKRNPFRFLFDRNVQFFFVTSVCFSNTFKLL